MSDYEYAQEAMSLSNLANLQALSFEERQILATQSQTAATLALAYAQETANLIAILSEGGPSIHVEDHLVNKDYLPLMQQLKERLNLA